MSIKKHSNRRHLNEVEFREFSQHLIRAIGLPNNLEFRLLKKTENKYARSDRLIKYNTSITKTIITELKENEKYTVSGFIRSVITPSLSMNLETKNWSIVLFNHQINDWMEGGHQLSRLINSVNKSNEFDFSEENESAIAAKTIDAEQYIKELSSLVDDSYSVVPKAVILALISQFGRISVKEAIQGVL